MAANEDFNIKVVTTADTAGLKQTSTELDAIKRKSEEAAAAMAKQSTDAESKWASSPFNPSNTHGSSPGAVTKETGVTGTAIGIGTIVTLLTAAVSKWKEFNAEQDRAVDNAIKAAEKMRELGDAILDMQDKARNAARVGVEPLYQSFIRLQQEIIKLKTEQSLLDLPRQGEEWKKLNAEIAADQSLLAGVTNKLKEQEAQANKTAEANRKAQGSFLKGALETASPQTQAVLKNEEAARKALAAGDQKSADQYQKTADQLKASMSQPQRDEYEGLTKPVRLGPKAGPGESQEAIDDIARNKINFDRQLRGEPPLPPQSGAGGAAGNQDIIDAMHQIWGY